MYDSICMAPEYWTRFHTFFVKNLIVQSNIKKYWIKRKDWGNLIFHEVLRFLTSLFHFVIHFMYIKTKTKNNDFPMFSTPNINILIRYVVILLLHERVCMYPYAWPMVQSILWQLYKCMSYVHDNFLHNTKIYIQTEKVVYCLKTY